MDEVLKDSTLPEDLKKNALKIYTSLQDCNAISKSTQSTNPLLNLPVHHNALTTRTTSLSTASTLTRIDTLSSSYC